MNMNALTETGNRINSAEIDKNQYFESLMKAAVRLQLISSEELAVIQKSMLKLLYEIADDYCAGESTSISNDEAVCLMESIVYTVDQVLRECDTPEQALNILKHDGISELYESGYEIIEKKLASSGELYRKITDNLFVTPNKFYRSTVVDGIAGFFKLYRPRFLAGETHITADYIPAAGRPASTGIEFIFEYLKRIYAENLFLVKFDQTAVHWLMCGLTPDYINSPCSIFLYVFITSIGLSLLSKPILELDLTKSDVEKLRRIFQGKNRKEALETINAQIKHIAIELEIENAAEIRDYMSLCLPIAASEIIEAVRNNTADKVFLIPLYEKQVDKTVFFDNEPMPDVSYRRLVNRLLSLDESAEKVDLILSDVSSIADLHDIVGDAYLTDRELFRIVKSLPSPVVDALKFRYCGDEFPDETGRRIRNIIKKYTRQ